MTSSKPLTHRRCVVGRADPAPTSQQSAAPPTTMAGNRLAGVGSPIFCLLQKLLLAISSYSSAERRTTIPMTALIA